MKRILFSILLLGICLTLGAQDAKPSANRRDNLERHVFTLADDSMKGRAAGSEDAARARAYITAEFSSLGIRPFFKNWEMPFEKKGAGSFCNVVGIIDGSDPALKDEYIVLGAHYDHLGTRNGEVYNGADDNASGTAAVIEVARTLAQCRGNLDRSVIIAAFDAEELGLFGSGALSKALTDSLGTKNIKLMMSIDMVGWYRQNGHLELEGTGTIKNGEKLVSAEAQKAGIDIKTRRFEISPFTATDTEGFARRGIPTLAVSTGLKSPYHKPGDDPELIDFDGLDKVSGYVTDLTLSVAGDHSFAASGRVADKHRSGNKPFEIGLWCGLAPTSVSFPDANFRTNARAGVTGGLSAQLNSGSFGFRLGAEYGCLPCNFPDESNIYSGSLRFRQQAITAPLTLLLETESSPVRGYIGVGGYYRRLLESGFGSGLPAYTAKPDQWGWQWVVGYQVGFLSMEIESRWQIGRYFEGPSDPRARLNTTSFKLGFIF